MSRRTRGWQLFAGATMASEREQDRAWRPLRMNEYPPPGPTKYGEPRKDGTRPILVYALKKRVSFFDLAKELPSDGE